MSKLTATIAALCCLVVGLFSGLLIGSLAGGSSQERGANTKAERPATPGGWKLLEEIPARLGPDSRFLPFAEELNRAGLWDPGDYWSISAPTNAFCCAHLMLTLVGEGKVYLEAIAHLGFRGSTQCG